jgi:hypothetical protein
MLIFEVVRSEVVEPSYKVNNLASPTTNKPSLKQNAYFERRPHQFLACVRQK